uniref:hAT-like transposase RNase-H fold domain-containing protein n=1 Tax=Arundo donax TaxID=35708 RepID=A0A0A9FKC0_ARUDO
MLEFAFPFRITFDELSKQGSNYTYAPSLAEWERSTVVCNFLKVFYNTTVVLSGSSYPTANRYFHELWKIKLAMDKECYNEDQDIVAMVKGM